MDQQETEVLAKRHRTEIGVYAFEFSPDSQLPAGWHYDASSNEFYLGETQDYWSYEDGFLVRHHVLGCKVTFDSSEAAFPVSSEELQSDRGFTWQRGHREIYANGLEQTSFSEVWFGKTLFPLTRDAAESRGLAYVGNLRGKFAHSSSRRLRARGHVWNAQGVPRKKAAKENAADLRERAR